MTHRFDPIRFGIFTAISWVAVWVAHSLVEPGEPITASWQAIGGGLIATAMGGYYASWLDGVPDVVADYLCIGGAVLGGLIGLAAGFSVPALFVVVAVNARDGAEPPAGVVVALWLLAVPLGLWLAWNFGKRGYDALFPLRYANAAAGVLIGPVSLFLIAVTAAIVLAVLFVVALVYFVVIALGFIFVGATIAVFN